MEQACEVRAGRGHRAAAPADPGSSPVETRSASARANGRFFGLPFLQEALDARFVADEPSHVACRRGLDSGIRELDGLQLDESLQELSVLPCETQRQRGIRYDAAPLGKWSGHPRLVLATSVPTAPRRRAPSFRRRV